MADFDVIIVGGGLAGLSVAWHLTRAGVTRVGVLEREWACGTRASGLNAAIFRHFEDTPRGVDLAVRSRALMDTLAPGLVRETGALYLGPPERLAHGSHALTEAGVPHERLTVDAIRARFPLLTPRTDGVFLPGDGVVDVHGLLAALQAGLKRAGAQVRCQADVVGLTVLEATAATTRQVLPEAAPRDLPSSTLTPDALARAMAAERPAPQPPAPTRDPRPVLAPSRGFSVSLASGESLTTRHLVLAGGAWSASLAVLLGLPLPIEPRRRHLAVLEPTTTLAPDHPVIWRLEHEVYFRPESGGVLASPCDEVAWPAGEVPTEPSELAHLGERLESLSPALHTSAVRRAWGCLRTFAPDREFVAGADPRLPGLHWLAGLGGRGVTCGLAAAAVVSAGVLGQPHPHGPSLSPGRLV